jgi:hypothetical protein
MPAKANYSAEAILEVPRELGGSARRRTPAEAAGIKVEGEDRWKTLIQNALSRKTNRS